MPQGVSVVTTAFALPGRVCLQEPVLHLEVYSYGLQAIVSVCFDLSWNTHVCFFRYRLETPNQTEKENHVYGWSHETTVIQQSYFKWTQLIKKIHPATWRDKYLIRHTQCGKSDSEIATNKRFNTGVTKLWMGDYHSVAVKWKYFGELEL